MSAPVLCIHGELEREARLQGEWFPAELLPNVLRFFRVPDDVMARRFFATKRPKEKCK